MVECATYAVLLQIITSHRTELQISGPSLTSPLTLQATEGKSSICIPGSGEYTATSNGCFLFGADKFTVTINPSSLPEPLVLKAVQVLVSGQVAVSKPSGEGDESSAAFTDNITIKSSVDGSDAGVEVVTKALPADPNSKDVDPTSRVYTYQLAVDFGSTFVIMPSAAEGHGLLFYPSSQVMKHDQGNKKCPPDVGVIEARAGLVLKGSTAPAVEGEGREPGSAPSVTCIVGRCVKSFLTCSSQYSQSHQRGI